MIDVRVREHHRIDLAGVHRQGLPVHATEAPQALEHAAVDEDPRLARAEEVLRARDGARVLIDGAWRSVSIAPVPFRRVHIADIRIGERRAGCDLGVDFDRIDRRRDGTHRGGKTALSHQEKRESGDVSANDVVDRIQRDRPINPALRAGDGVNFAVQ